MIRMPRRSVTRYFIPLIDVMILLFCIFLLMPIFKESDPENPDMLAIKRLERELLLRTKQRDETEGKLKALDKKTFLPLQQRLAIHVLEVDPKDGRLFYYEDRLKRTLIDKAETAWTLIGRHQHGEIRELHYLILLPRVDSAYPEGQQLEDYKKWFKDKGVSVGTDRPGAVP